MVDEGVPLAEFDDRSFVQAVRLQRFLRRSKGADNSERAAAWSGSDYQAYVISTAENATLWELRARLLGRESLPEIAHKMGLAEDVVRLFNEWFFDVRNDEGRAARDPALCKVLIPAFESSPIEEAAAVLYIGYAAPTAALDTYVRVILHGDMSATDDEKKLARSSQWAARFWWASGTGDDAYLLYLLDEYDKHFRREKSTGYQAVLESFVKMQARENLGSARPGPPVKDPANEYVPGKTYSLPRLWAPMPPHLRPARKARAPSDPCNTPAVDGADEQRRPGQAPSTTAGGGSKAQVGASPARDEQPAAPVRHVDREYEAMLTRLSPRAQTAVRKLARK